MELSMEVRTVKELREFLQKVEAMGLPEDARIKAVVKMGGSLYKLKAEVRPA